MDSPQSRSFLRVGITGGIGSGKSTVAGIFSDLGRLVISADDIARTIGNENALARESIRTAFGSIAYLPDGTLNRKIVASIVFADAKKREKLNSIIHPLVFNAIEHQFDSLPLKRKAPYSLIEAALIYETGMDDWLDYVIVVAADEELCIKRVVVRDNLSEDDVRRRMAAQLSVEHKVKAADFVIRNDKPVSELRSPVMLIDTILSQPSPVRTP